MVEKLPNGVNLVSRIRRDAAIYKCNINQQSYLKRLFRSKGIEIGPKYF